MAKISKYTAVSAPADSDVYVVVQGGVTKKITYAQIKTVASVAKSSAYTILDADGFQTLYVSGNTVIKLPVASIKRLIRFKKTDSNTTTVQIRKSDTGADTIEGNETVILREPYDSVILESDGTATWYKF